MAEPISILVAKINRTTSLTFSKLTCCAYLICKRTELIFIILAFYSGGRNNSKQFNCA